MSDNVGYALDLTSGDTTDDATPMLSGTLSGALRLGETVSIYGSLNGGTPVLLGTGQVSGTAWSFTPPTGLVTGGYSFTVKVENTAAGVSGPESVPFELSVSSLSLATMPPYTADATPELSGTLGATLGDGETIHVYRLVNGVATKVAGSLTFNGLNWTFEPETALTIGTHQLVAVVQATADTSLATGRVVSNVTTFVVDTRENVDATLTVDATLSDNVSTAGSMTGNLASGLSTDDTQPTFNGSLSHVLTGAEVVAVYATLSGVETRLGTAILNGNRWSFTPAKALAAGSYEFSFKVENLASGGSSAAVTFQTIIHTGMELLVYDDAGDAQGPVGNNGLTDDTTPTLSGTLTAYLATGEVVAIYSIVGGVATWLANATHDGRTWSYTPSEALAPGSYTLHAAVQASGVTNMGLARVVSAATTLVIDTDTEASAKTATILSAADNVGTNGSQGSETSPVLLGHNQATDDTTPTLSGTVSAALAANEVVAIYNGTERLGTATMNGTTWSFTTPVLTSGSYSFTAVVEKPASGSAGAPSPAFALRVHADFGSFNVADNVGSKQGNLLAEDANAETVSEGVPPLVTDDTTPTLSGQLATALVGGETVSIWNGSVRLGQANLGVDNTSWSFTPSTALTHGSYQLSFKVESDGKVLLSSPTFSLTVGNAAPTQLAEITQVFDNYGSQTGELSSGGLTDDATLFLVGRFSGASLLPNQVVAIYAGNTYLGAATVNGVQWTFTTPQGMLTPGLQTLTARVENLATGQQGVISAGFDVQYQEISISAVTDDQGWRQGNVLATGFSDDRAPQIEIRLGQALSGGQKIAIYNGDVRLGDATLSEDATVWTYQFNSDLSDGTYNLTARIEDSSNKTLLTSSTVPLEVRTDQFSESVIDGNLSVLGSGESIDLTSINADTGQVAVSLVDLTGQGANQLKLNLDDVLMTLDNIMRIVGTEDDTLEIADLANWTMMSETQTDTTNVYNVYTNGDGVLWVDTDMKVI